MKHKRQSMAKADEPDKKGSGEQRAGMHDDATNNNTKSVPSSPDSMCSSDVKKEESNDSLPLPSASAAAGVPPTSASSGVPGGPRGGTAPVPPLDSSKVKCEDGSGLRYPGPLGFTGEGLTLKDGGPQDMPPLNTPPIPRATPPLTPATPTASPAHLTGTRGVPGSPALATPPTSSSRTVPLTATTTASAAASTSNAVTPHGFGSGVSGRAGAGRGSTFSSYCGTNTTATNNVPGEGKGRGVAGSYAGAYRGSWADQYRGMGRATPPQFMANTNTRASSGHSYDYTCAQQQQQQRGQHMYNGGYTMDGYNYNRHYYNNNMMCGDGYSSYNYMYSNGGMYACGGQGDASAQQYYDSYAMCGATGYDQTEKGAAMTTMAANNPANMANMAGMGQGGGYYNNGSATGGTGGEGVAYPDQQYHHQQHEHDLNFTFNFFEQSGNGGGAGGGPGGGGQGGGTGGSTAPSENSNSSDFNFLTNLANDFAPEYYQLS